MDNKYNYDLRNLIFRNYTPLYNDLKDKPNFPHVKPKLAHYTSIRSLESIMKTKELWFSNPLLMNDYEEMCFGLREGSRLISSNKAIREACHSSMIFEKLLYMYNYFASAKEQDLDVYIFCFSEHTDDDGLLSMWRGYGGDGSGVALVFDLSKVTPMPQSPLIVSKVEYFTAQQRTCLLNNLLNQFAEILQTQTVTDENIWLHALAIYRRIFMFSITSKHNGFIEEREWRVIYYKEHDINNDYNNMFSYYIGDNIIEPKLKLSLIDDKLVPHLSFCELIDKIILGPTSSSHTIVNTIKRMLDILKLQELKDKVTASSIPYRTS